MNINDKTDEEIRDIALPIWDEQLQHSRDGDYQKFIKNFSNDILANINPEVAAQQFVQDKLTRSLSPDYDFLGLLRRDNEVTCLFRVYSTEKEGEWLGRMVIGYDRRDEVKIFASSIF